MLLRAPLIHTLSSGPATAMLVACGRILAIGDESECRAAAKAHGLAVGEAHELDGVVVPGFVDAHAHPLMYGQLLTWVDCGPDAAGSIPEIIALLRAALPALPEGKPLRGYGYEQTNLAEGRHPTRFDLDQVATDREIYLMNASGHGGVVNSYTLEKNGITDQTPNPPGGEFFRDAEGRLTGELSDAACDMLTGRRGVKVGRHGPNFHLADSPAEHLLQLSAAQERFLAGGVTAVGDAQVSRRELETYLALQRRGGLRLRVAMYFLSHLLDEVLEIGLTGPFGDDHLRFAGIKLYADGTLGGWTAYFPEGYLGDPCRTGQLYHEPEEYARLVRTAHLAGLQTATHAQSPTAIEMVVSAIEAALAERPDPDARHRIEHCGLPTAEQIARMVAAGIRPVNQPQHYFNWGEGVTTAIGTPGERFNPLGEFVEAGLPVTLSSDAPVADPLPLEAIQVAVDRVTRNGHRLGPDDLRITAEQALAAHTLEGARSLGLDREIGSLESGKRADFAVLSEDPLRCPVDQISSIRVVQTWIDGLPQYRAP